MSNGGSFKLLTNDGKQDDMICATPYLNQRLQKIQQVRSQDSRIQDPTPTLADIEKTHILFVNVHFRPHVSLANEYQVQTITKVQLNSNAQFSIPLYGDFINDMVLSITLGSVSAPATGTGNQFLRYVEYPGERVCKNSNITINGNLLDEYPSDVYPFYRDFNVSPNKKVGYDRCMGQQTLVDGYTQFQGGRSVAVREKRVYVNGPQTPQAVQPALNLLVPLLFWFSKDVRLSLISVSIPHGQRFINFYFEQAQNLLQCCGINESYDAPSVNPVPIPDITSCFLYINNIFVNPEIHSIIIKRIGFSLIRVHKWQRQVLQNASDNILLSSLKWPIETMHVGFKPVVNQDPANANMWYTWHRYSVLSSNVGVTGSVGVNTSYGLTLVGAALAGPITCTNLDADLAGANGVALLPPGNTYFETTLVKYGVVATGATVPTYANVNLVLATLGLAPLTVTVGSLTSGAAFLLALPSTAGSSINSFQQSQSVDRIGVEAHGVSLFQDYSSAFYNNYLPLRYGEEKSNTPEDTGKYLIPFNFYPGTYQPSGHINVSRAREFYLRYTSSYISASSNVEMFVLGTAINFLLVSDGSAVLRYAT
jgi:hypothetical protein